MKNALRFVLKTLGWCLAGAAGLFLALQFFYYLTAPVYDFQKPKPFSGPLWYNPYAHMDSSCWRKANFHFHTREWFGLTAGRHNTTRAFWNTYNLLGYDVPYISNYQSISRFNQDSAFYIPVYEHGFGIRKKHQLLLGAHQVLWRDYSLFQNLNHRQHIINLLRRQSDIVVIAHPDWEAGYSLRDMAYLSNYDLAEILDRNWRSIPQWDAALSAGRPVFLLSDDDAHDIADPWEIGVCATLINSCERTRDSLIAALKAGNAYGLDVRGGDSFPAKALRLKKIPEVKSVQIHNDTLRVRIGGMARKIEFIGQNGVRKKEVFFSDRAEYPLQPGDTYIRAVFTFDNPYWRDGAKIYLNPVFRYDGKRPYNELTAEVNWERTWIFRLMLGGSLIVLVFVILKLRKLRKERKNI